VRDDGVGLEESQLICAYLDCLDGRPAFEVQHQQWEARRLEALARSLMDGLAVWMRELYRPPNERSPGIIQHEIARAIRFAELWEREIEHRYMHGVLNMAQLTLACALGLEARMPDLDWRSGHPRLCDWYGVLAARASFQATAPPGR
jgi:glutathione S-transferase